MSAVEAALAVRQRIGRRTHLPQVRIGADMQLADKLQIVVQHLAERTALLLCLSVDHRQVQRYRTNVPAADKYRLVVLVRRLHAAALEPRRQERTAAHRADNRAVLFVHTRHITLAGERKPVRVHRAGRAQDTGFKYILERLTGSVQIFVIQEYDLREQYGLLLTLFTLPLAAHVQHGDGGQLCESARAGAHRHSDERIVAAAGCYRVELVFPALEALLKVVENIRHNFLLDRISIQTQTSILLGHHFVAALGIRLEQ